MAQTKSTTKKQPQKSSAKKGPAKSGSSNKNDKRGSSVKTRTDEKVMAARKELAAIIIFCLALLMMIISVFSGADGSFLNKLHMLRIGVCGFTAYIFPVVFAVFAFLLSKTTEGYRHVKFIVCALLFTGLISAFWFVVRSENISMSYAQLISAEYSTHSTFAGAVGAIAGGCWIALTGSRGASVAILVVLILVVVLISTGTTIMKLFDAFGKAGKAVGKTTEKGVAKIAESFSESNAVRKREFDPNFDKSLRQTHDDNKKTVKKSKPVETSHGEGFEDFFSETPEAVAPVAAAAVVTDAGEAPSTGTEDDLLDLDNIFANIELEQKKDVKPDTAVDIPFDIPSESTAEMTVTDKKDKPAPVGEAEMEQMKSEIDESISSAEEPVKVYLLPPLECLSVPTGEKFMTSRDELKNNADKLIAALKSFNVEAKILDIVPGPSVTRYELSPAPGMKISKFMNLADDLALHLAAPAGVRIEAPIPNKSAIGIEIPNRSRATVLMREIIDCDEYRNAKSKLTVALGKDIAGSSVFADIAKMPHLLIAGTTGSGKSVCLNTMLVSLLYNASPSEVKLLLIDPKTVEFSVYNGIPHLLVPVVNDARKAAGALGWAVTEMINRYKMLNDNGVRDIYAYNSLCDGNPELERMPQIVIVIDELSDLMSVAPSEVEDSITRLAQMARAAGMHLVVATQRPSVDVITGLIKANIPSRIALSVSSQIDSRTIIDMGGAEKLLGLGDMLFYPVGMPKPLRVQGCYLSSSEIERVVSFIKTQETSSYSDEIQQEIERQAVVEKKKGAANSDSSQKGGGDGDLLERAIEFVVTNPEYCSISSLQRKLGLGFSKAGRVMDELEQRGVVGPTEGSKPRKVLMTKAELMEMQAMKTDDNPAE